MSAVRPLLDTLYTRLFDRLGPQGWWPAHTPFEMMIGAVLTQHTAWRNVERAIDNLRELDALTPAALLALPLATLQEAVRPAGVFRVKAARLRHLTEYFVVRHGGDMAQLRAVPAEQLRAELLAVRGIGPETADCILLYAALQPSFVVDTYTHRILHRHGLAPEESSYEELQTLFMDHLPPDIARWNEFHALLVAAGKQWCRARAPRCGDCPLRGVNWAPEQQQF